MANMIDFGAPLAGLDRARQSLEHTATRVAVAVDPSGDTVDLSAEMIAMILAKNLFAVNATFLKAEIETSRSLVNLIG